MPKPTLLQTILHRPSQSYHYPSTKDYHSRKRDLLAARLASTQDESKVAGPSGTTHSDDDETRAVSRSSSMSHPRKHSSRRLARSHSTGRAQPLPEADVKPKPILIRSIASSHHPSQQQHSDGPSSSHAHLNPTPRPLRAPRSRPRFHRTAGNDGDAENGSDADDDDDDDQFFTPRSSFYPSSPRLSRNSAAMLLEPQLLASALFPHMQASQSVDPEASPVSRIPSSSSISEASSSSSSSAVSPVSERDNHSLFSAQSKATDSTRLTTPHGSAASDVAPKVDEAERITVVPRPRPHTVYVDADAATAALQAKANRRRSLEEAKTVTYTDEDWAKDVRWLVPPKPFAADSPRSSPRGSPFGSPRLSPFGSPAESPYHSPHILPEAISAEYLPDLATLPPPHQLPPPHLAYPTPQRPKMQNRRSGTSSARQSRILMSALWEEDESSYSPSSADNSREPSRSGTPVLETPPPLGQNHASSSAPNLRDWTRARTHSAPNAVERPKFPQAPPVDLGSSESLAPSPVVTPDSKMQEYARLRTHLRSLSSVSGRGSPLAQPSLSSADMTLPTYQLPTPFPTSQSTQTKGYASLTLPRAGYSNEKGKKMAEGRVDLVRAGLAQSSMATVEIVRGAASKRGTFSLPRSFFSKAKQHRESATPAHLQGTLPVPVAFTAHLSPPKYVPGSHVLVQVWAVGLDGLDSLLVHEKVGSPATLGGASWKARSKAAGFVPGRSFVGKAIECGWEVKEEVCKRGDWVIGLLDLRKCGALTEFVLVERHRVHRAPKPRSRTATLFPPFRRVVPRTQSLPAHSPLPVPTAPSPSRGSSAFSVEELALLPLAGLPAYRAVRTFLDTIAVSKSALGRSRALILHGQDGIGLFAMQMLKKRGVKVCVQVPEWLVHEDKPAQQPASEQEKESASSGSDTPARPGAERRNTVDVGVQFPDDEVLRGLRVDVGVQASSDEEQDAPSDGSGREEGSSDDDVLEARRRERGKERERTLSSVSEMREVGKHSDAVAEPKTRLARLEARLRSLGADEVCVGEPLEVLQRFAAEGRSFDAILDTVGGVGIWEAAQKVLLADPFEADVAPPAEQDARRKRTATVAQFTTTVGDASMRAVPTSHDNFHSGLRSFRRTKSTMHHGAAGEGKARRSKKGHKRTVSYSWVSPAADVDLDGEDVRSSLGAVVRMAEDGTLKPTLADDGEAGGEESRVVPFERAPEVFRRDLRGPRGLLKDGGACVVKIVG